MSAGATVEKVAAVPDDGEEKIAEAVIGATS